MVEGMVDAHLTDPELYEVLFTEVRIGQRERRISRCDRTASSDLRSRPECTSSRRAGTLTKSCLLLHTWWNASPMGQVLRRPPSRRSATRKRQYEQSWPICMRETCQAHRDSFVGCRHRTNWSNQEEFRPAAQRREALGNVTSASSTAST